MENLFNSNSFIAREAQYVSVTVNRVADINELINFNRPSVFDYEIYRNGTVALPVRCPALIRVLGVVHCTQAYVQMSHHINDSTSFAQLSTSLRKERTALAGYFRNSYIKHLSSEAGYADPTRFRTDLHRSIRFVLKTSSNWIEQRTAAIAEKYILDDGLWGASIARTLLINSIIKACDYALVNEGGTGTAFVNRSRYGDLDSEVLGVHKWTDILTDSVRNDYISWATSVLSYGVDPSRVSLDAFYSELGTHLKYLNRNSHADTIVLLRKHMLTPRATVETSLDEVLNAAVAEDVLRFIARLTCGLKRKAALTRGVEDHE